MTFKLNKSKTVLHVNRYEKFFKYECNKTSFISHSVSYYLGLRKTSSGFIFR